MSLSRPLHSAFATLVMAGALAAPAHAALPKPESIRPDLGVVIILNLDGRNNLPSLITNVLGAGLVYPLGPGTRWSFEPSVDFCWSYYELSNGRAVPSGITQRQASVFTLLVEAPMVYSLPLGGKWAVGAGGGLALNIRIGFQAADDVSQADVAAINAYLWSMGRFLMPSTLARVEYRLNDRVEFGFTARALWPIFNVWAGEGLSLFDQGIFGAQLGVRYRF